MIFNFGLKSSVLLIFFSHGLFFSILLFSKWLQTDNKASFWLSLFTLFCSLYIAPFMFGYAGWYATNPYRDILFYFPFQQLFLIAPVLYFYFRTLLDKSFCFSKKDYLHFLPALLYILYSLVVFVTDKFILKTYYFYADGEDKDFSTWYQIAGLFSFTFYLIICLKTYNKYKAMTFDVVSYADSVLFKWAQRFLIAFLILIAIRILFFILNPEWDEFGKKFWYYLCFSMLFYYVSVFGFANSMVSMVSFKESYSFSDQIVLNTRENIENKDVLSEDYDTNFKEKTEIQDLELWKTKIENLMLVDKIYENPELTILDVCILLNTHVKKISQVVNQGFNMNFNDFINHYRIKALINKIEEKQHTYRTLLSLAFDCGFNSKSTFNRAFKRYTHLNPRDYIEKHLK